MLRNIYDWDCGEETNFWFIIKDSLSEDTYSKKTQKYLHKANDRFEFRLIDKELLREQGYHVYESAYANYKVNDGFRETPEAFISRIDSMDDSIDIWGAIDKETGKLEAYSICKKDGDIVSYQSSKANPEFLPKYYVMYGLYDARDQYYLGEKKYWLAVSSARSISEHSNIQTFLIEKFGFRKAYCKMTLYYCWWLRTAVTLLYPFKSYIKYPKIANILRFEAIRRGEY